MPKRASSKGWEVWVWRAPITEAFSRRRRPGLWRVYMLMHYPDDEPPEGGDCPSGAVTVKVCASGWIEMFGGELFDIPRKPTLMVLRGTAETVT